MKKIEAYGCDHCGMTSRHKASVLRHERESCRQNDRQTCKNCLHYSFGEDGHSCDKLDYMPDVNGTNNSNDCEVFYLVPFYLDREEAYKEYEAQLNKGDKEAR